MHGLFLTGCVVGGPVYEPRDSDYVNADTYFPVRSDSRGSNADVYFPVEGYK